MDLIAMLPGENFEDFKYSVKEAIKLNPENIIKKMTDQLVLLSRDNLVMMLKRGWLLLKQMNTQQFLMFTKESKHKLFLVKKAKIKTAPQML